MRTVAALLTMCAAAGAQDFRWPVNGWETQNFYGTFSGRDAGTYYNEYHQAQWFAGYNATGTRLHRAIDIGCSTGTPVRAARGGTAYRFGSTSHFYGYYMIVDHGYGYFTLYAHLSSFVAAHGGSVSAGTLIAYSGATGNVTGPHLHFEIRHSGNSAAYAPEAHYVPSEPISSGSDIDFDYPGIPPINGSSLPAMPVLYSPTNGATVAAGTVTLDWADVAGADYYYVAVYQSGTLVHEDWPAVSASWPTLGGGSYTWSVYAHNSAGYGPGSSAGFTVSASVGTPTGLWPDQWASMNGPSVTLDWSDAGSSYVVEILYWTGSAWQAYYTYYPGNSSMTFWPQIHYSYYAWRVRASPGGNWSHWATFYFNG